MAKDYTINKRIKNLRISKSITQEQMGSFLGIKTSTYSQLERKGVFTAQHIVKLAPFLDVDYPCLLEGKTLKNENVDLLSSPSPVTLSIAKSLVFILLNF